MIKRYSHYALTILLSLWITSKAIASETPEIRAIAVGLENNLKDLEILDANLKSVGQLSLRPFSYSQAFTCPIVEKKLLFGIPDGIDEDGAPQFKLVASFEWAKSDEGTCLLFLPKSIMVDNASSEDYTIQAMDMDLRAFKMGHTRIINLTPWETTVSAEEQTATTAAWDRSSFRKIKETSGVNMIQIEVSYIEEGTQKMAYQTRMRYLENSRYTIFIYSDIKNKRVRAHVIKDSGNLFQ